MPKLYTKPPAYRKTRKIDASWDNWRKGLNLLLRPTELGRDEYAQGDNIILIGSGVPTGRWGTSKYFTVNATGSIRGFGQYATGASLSEILALSDEGYLVKQAGASYTRITGQSWPSGSIITTEQLGGKTYIVSEDVTFTTYDGSGLTVRATLAPPTGVTATNYSGATGTNIQSYRITTTGVDGGETTGSTNYVIENLPSNLSDTEIHVFWTGTSAATLGGYSIYRGDPGYERWLAAVGASVTKYVDRGGTAAETILPPLTNSTGGVKSKFIIKFLDRLLVVDKDDPTKLMISARYPDHDKFDWAAGGGYIYIDPDSGQDITALTVQPGANKIVVYKDYAHYAVELQTVSIGSFSILDPVYTPISTAIGASNARTIQTVENDIFYFGRKGIYVTGYEPNFLSIIRTNEVSARMRPYLELLGASDYDNANALYVDNKYLLSFPDRKEILVYDRERGCFAGVWKLPWGITHMYKFVDDSGTERWVIGTSESNQTYTFETSVNSDDGTTITKTLRTNKEDFGSWTELKIVELFHILLRNITGEVNVNVLLEDRNGNTTTIKTFTVQGTSVRGETGYGAITWGESLWGKSQGGAVSGGDEFTRWGNLFKTGRLIQLEVSCTASNSNFELLGIEFTAKSMGKGSLSSSQRV